MILIFKKVLITVAYKHINSFADSMATIISVIGIIVSAVYIASAKTLVYGFQRVGEV
jgi:hypothetical protein